MAMVFNQGLRSGLRWELGLYTCLVFTVIIPHICHFFYTGRIFENQILHPKTTKGTQNTKNVSEKVKYMQFFHSIWKNLHLT